MTSRLDQIASSLPPDVWPRLARAPSADDNPSGCTAAMSGTSWTCRRTVAPFTCASQFVDFAALSPVARATFSPSGSMTRLPVDLPGARSGWRQSSTISALPWAVALPRRRHAACDRSPLRVIGIDDWAWKRGQRYGSIICDLERRRVVDLLPDREPETVKAWLSHHPEIAVISRDRGGSYGRAAARAAPQAVQVADRWHLMENASAAFLEAVRRSMRSIRQALGSAAID